MNDKGYVYMKDVLSPDDTEYALSAYNGTLVDYPKMRDFIDNRFLPAVTRKLPYITDPRYVKFRFSDNNNSTDAAVVHRDVYNYTSEKSLPNLTVLCYFDDSEMELHEYSHGAFSTDLVSCYGTKKRIRMSKGDVLVFYSTMLHRGVKFGKSKHRRLLQVFDVYPTKLSRFWVSLKELTTGVAVMTQVALRLMESTRPYSFPFLQRPWCASSRQTRS